MTLTNPTFAVDTAFTGKNISSAASVYEYTATASGWYAFTVRLTNAAGNGDYVAYLTQQWGGTGTDSPFLPKTTLTAASGETDFTFGTMVILLKAADVVNVMVDGLAGDTSVSGNIRAGLMNFSILDTTDVTSTVTITTATAASASSGSIAITTYDTFSQGIPSTSTAAIDTATKVWFALKATRETLDTASIVFIEKTDGLTIVNGSSDGVTAGNGTLAISGSSGSWTVTVGIDESVTGQLGSAVSSSGVYACIKYKLGNDTLTLWDGWATISHGIIKAVS